ncbi:hypothetical protein Ciccas_003111 [Cichlidogyrus casuarinus]|uniref:Bridge-like lipid transfer protein family member 1 C-terminal domain-containing protein n=1 Tax=Cichlidogyrus casuarinus TaxID=1844966 RepID=A0ABD2QFA4_9PLAT
MLIPDNVKDQYHLAPNDTEGWINLRQVLSFEFHAEGPQLHPHMAYVLLTEFDVDFNLTGVQQSKIVENNSSSETQQPESNVQNGETGTTNPMKPPNTAEMYFVLPSISLRLVSDQQQPMTNLFYEQFFGSSGELSENPPEMKGSPLVPQVRLSFQTDFHGAIQLGYNDFTWLPMLIRSYIKDTYKSDKQSSAPSTSNRQVPPFCQTHLPTIQDAREYHVIHWNLSPEFRWLTARNIGVPVVDNLLGLIGFTKARVTIPKWLQRGLMDRLDSLVAGLVQVSLQLIPQSTEIEASKDEPKDQDPASES